MQRRLVVSPYGVLAGGILAVSTASVLIRFAQQELPSLVIAAGRLSLAALLLAPLALLRRRQELAGLGWRTWALLGLAGVLLALHFSAWISSLALTSVASSVVLVTTTPIWVGLLSGVVLQERPAGGIWLGMAVALTGGMIVGFSEICKLGMDGLRCGGLGSLLGGKVLLGNFLALCGAWFACGYLLVGRGVRGQVSLLTYVFVVYSAAAMTLVLFAALSGARLGGYSGRAWGLLFLLALVPQLLGHSALNWALKQASASFVALALLGEPIGSIFLAMALLGELPTWLEMAGGSLILVGIYLAGRASTPPAEKQQGSSNLG